MSEKPVPKWLCPEWRGSASRSPQSSRFALQGGKHDLPKIKCRSAQGACHGQGSPEDVNVLKLSFPIG